MPLLDLDVLVDVDYILPFLPNADLTNSDRAHDGAAPLRKGDPSPCKYDPRFGPSKAASKRKP